uniref:FecR domain-containing protein n=2 Tax=Pseudomonadota TaxID=1224 RepID=UPI0019545503
TPPRARRARLPAGRLAAGLTAAAVLAGGGAWFLADRPPTYESQVGEMRRLVLADGSVLTLNTDSAVVVRMAKDRRRIALK